MTSNLKYYFELIEDLQESSNELEEYLILVELSEVALRLTQDDFDFINFYK
jgi:hypothetical protein